MTLCDQGAPCERSITISTRGRIDLIELGNIVVGVALALALSDVVRNAHLFNAASIFNSMALPSIVSTGVLLSLWLLYSRIASAVINLKTARPWVRDLLALATLVPLQLIIVSAELLPDSIGRWHGIGFQMSLLTTALALAAFCAIALLCLPMSSNDGERKEFRGRGIAALIAAMLLVALFFAVRTSNGTVQQRRDLGDCLNRGAGLHQRWIQRVRPCDVHSAATWPGHFRGNPPQ
jgi:hypothetical protein